MDSRIVKDSLDFGLLTVTCLETFATVTGASLKDILPQSGWFDRLVVVLAVFTAASIAACVVKYGRYRLCWRVSFNVGGNRVNICRGDMFVQEGWKVIPCTDRFDTKLVGETDGVIARDSINGQFLLGYAGDISSLEDAVADYRCSKVGRRASRNGRVSYGIGTVIPYRDEFALLAFARLNRHNEVCISMPLYETCLMDMWAELNRIYNSRQLVLPLVGGGITRFEDRKKPGYDELLSSMLHTLRVAGVSFDAPITIVLSDKVLQDMHLYQVMASVADGLRG